MDLFLEDLINLSNETSIGSVNIEKLKVDIKSIQDGEKIQDIFKSYIQHEPNPLEGTNLLILACKYNIIGILEYIFDNIFNNAESVSEDNGNAYISPFARDSTGHDCFYYTIRSSNVKLLDFLIKKWPGNFFAQNQKALYDNISKSYVELKLWNVFLSFEIQSYIERKLIDSCFFSNDSSQEEDVKEDSLIKIKARIDLVLDDIALLKKDYGNGFRVDAKFLYVAKCLAKNIHILKQQLKSTYDKVPWEEIEFCIISFILSLTKRDEINLHIRPVLNVEKILAHLENFSNCLKDHLKDLYKSNLTALPNHSREVVIKNITTKYPKMNNLYNDYRQVRDVYSLEKMRKYIYHATLANSKEKEGQLVILRALQVIGEHMKNTLPSPKLSDLTIYHFDCFVPQETRTCVVKLRNELSHYRSMHIREEIEESDAQFFVNIQSNFKKIGENILHILYLKKIKAVRFFLDKFVHLENITDLKDIFETLSDLDIEEISSKCYESSMKESFPELIEAFSRLIECKTDLEENAFNKIKKKIKFPKKLSGVKTVFSLGYKFLRDFYKIIGDAEVNKEWSDAMIDRAKDFLKLLHLPAESQMKQEEFIEIAKLMREIFSSFRKREPHDQNLPELKGLMSKILEIIEFHTEDVNFIKDYQVELSKSKDLTNPNDTKSALNLKLNILKNIVNCNSSDMKKKLLPLEILILDIMSILGEVNKCLAHNQLFLDEKFPLLTGKCLRNHLAHDNALMETMLFDPSLAIIGNAEKLARINDELESKIIGKLVKDNPSSLKLECEQDLALIAKQDEFFRALENGKFKAVSNLLQEVDIWARNINSGTALHFAAKGNCLEIVKFILRNKLDAKITDINGQSALHIAAAAGRDRIAKYFIEEGIIPVDIVDNDKKTPLHVASLNGHLLVVKVLLENKATASMKDKFDSFALHYAMRNNHMKVAQLLIQHGGSYINKIKNSYFLSDDVVSNQKLLVKKWYSLSNL